MAIYHLEQAKKLRKYFNKLGRKGVAERVIEIAREIVKQEGAYMSTIRAAGMIQALMVACKEDGYWDEKRMMGFSDMVWEAEQNTKEK